MAPYSTLPLDSDPIHCAGDTTFDYLGYLLVPDLNCGVWHDVVRRLEAKTVFCDLGHLGHYTMSRRKPPSLEAVSTAAATQL